MEMTTLGRTGVQVSRLCFGAMTLGSWGNTDEGECIRMVHRALDAGINFIDTADVYGSGDSEAILGQALAGKRDEVVLATKVNHQFGEGFNHSGNSRRWIFRQIDESLRRLKTDWIDLYQLHRPDPATDISESLGALTDLVRAGKVRSIGTSTFAAHEIVEAHWAAERRGSSGRPASRRRTRCSCAGSRPTCCPSRSATAWARSSGARSAPAG